MNRARTAIWIHVSHCSVNGNRRFTKTSRDDFYFAFVCCDVSNGEDAWKSRFHLAICHDSVASNLKSPVLHSSNRRREAIVHDKNRQQEVQFGLHL